MNIKGKLATLCEYFHKSRRSGHTTAMLQGAIAADCNLVLVSDKTVAEHLYRLGVGRDEIVVLEQLDVGLKGRFDPLLIDNSATLILVSEALREIQRLENKVDLIKRMARELVEAIEA